VKSKKSTKVPRFNRNDECALRSIVIQKLYFILYSKSGNKISANNHRSKSRVIAAVYSYYIARINSMSQFSKDGPYLFLNSIPVTLQYPL